MTLHTSADAPINCTYWDELVDEDGFLALGRNRYHCSYVVYTDGTYYYAENGATGNLDFGGPNNLGGISGVSAYAVIQATIDAIGVAGGGGIFVKNGVYSDVSLLFDDNVPLTFRGESNETVFTCTVAGGAIRLSGINNRIKLESFAVELSGSADIGIWLGSSGGCRYAYLDNIYIIGESDTDGRIGILLGGATAQGNAWHNVLSNIRIEDIEIGLQTENGTTYSPNRNDYYNLRIAEVGTAINLLGGINHQLYSPDIGGCSVTGIYINVNHVTIITPRIEFSGASVLYNMIITGSASNILIIKPYLISGRANTDRINDASLRSYFIEFSYVGGVNAEILFRKNGSNYFYVDSNGQVWAPQTRRSGTATITAAATSIVVAHGCGFAPDAGDIRAFLTNQPTNDIGNVWFSAIGAANFTINCRNVPGVATAVFAWSVDMLM